MEPDSDIWVTAVSPDHLALPGTFTFPTFAPLEEKVLRDRAPHHQTLTSQTSPSPPTSPHPHLPERE